MIGFSGIYILIKYLTMLGVTSPVVNVYFFCLTGLGFLGLNIFRGQEMGVSKPLWPAMALLVCFAIFGNYFSVKAYETAPNPGYAAAITAASVIILTLFSVFAFGSELTPMRGLGVALSVVGVVILVLS